MNDRFRLQPPAQERPIRFGTLRLYRESRLLFNGEAPVRLGGRAMDLLIALVDRAPAVVTKAELETLVWPRVVVEESSLRGQVGALRKLLGDDGRGARTIANVPGRGYAFVAPIELQDESRLNESGSGVLGVPSVSPHLAPFTPDAPQRPDMPNAPRAATLGASTTLPPACALLPPQRLPRRLTRMLGRERETDAVLRMVHGHRMVTITGPGGIGKTTLAIAVAEQVVADGGVELLTFVDLAAHTGRPQEHSADAGAIGTDILGAIGAAMGLRLEGERAEELLLALLRHRPALLVLDNCEHRVHELAPLVATLLGEAPLLRILATSREALQAGGERVHRLEALALPPPTLVPDAAQALRYPAVALLVERITADAADFVLGDADAPLAAELCRRLDGLPLVIEMAAARVAVLGLRDLVEWLPSRLMLLGGSRTQPPRQQTLRALYDWSHAQLAPESQAVFRALSVFRGSFTLEAAACAAHGSGPDDAALVQAIIDLVDKSLLMPDFDGHRVRYRMLETCRPYAAERLRHSDCAAPVRRRHARYLCQALTRARAQESCGDQAHWLDAHASLLEEALDALDWVLAGEEDTLLGVELAQAMLPVVDQWDERATAPLQMRRPRLHGGFTEIHIGDDNLVG